MSANPTPPERPQCVCGHTFVQHEIGELSYACKECNCGFFTGAERPQGEPRLQLEMAAKGCVSGELTEWPKLISAAAWALNEIDHLTARVRELEREDICDVCAGRGNPGTGKPCVCGGTGKATRQAAGFRDSINDLHRQMEAVERERDRLIKENGELRKLLHRSLQLARPWMDGKMTYENWDKLFTEIDAALSREPARE